MKSATTAQAAASAAAMSSTLFSDHRQSILPPASAAAASSASASASTLQLVAKCVALHDTLSSAMDKITAQMPAASKTQQTTLVGEQVDGYVRLFGKLVQLLSNWLECMEGARAMNKRASAIGHMLTDLSTTVAVDASDHHDDFFQLVEATVAKAYRLSSLLHDQQGQQPTTHLDLDLFFEPSRALKRLIYERMVTIAVSNTAHPPPQLLCFRLDYVNTSNTSTTTTAAAAATTSDMEQPAHLFIDNIHVANACFDLASASFRSTHYASSMHSMSKLRRVRLTPMTTTMTTSEAEMLTIVPFVDATTGDIVCMLAIRYMHDKCLTSSPSSPTASFALNTPSANKNNNNTTTTPIYNRVYFCIHNVNRALIKAIEAIAD